MTRHVTDPALLAARAAIDGTDLKLRYASDATAFGITERLAPLMSSLWWSRDGELAVIGALRPDGWQVWCYDRRKWQRFAGLRADEVEGRIRSFIKAVGS